MYRPTAPSVRAQSIQVINAAWATAARGHQVTVAVQAPKGLSVGPGEVLAFYGLETVSGLTLQVLPAGNTPASIAFRASFARWLIQSRGRGIAIARSKRYAREAIGWAGGQFRLVLEAHEVDSAQLVENGENGSEMRQLERLVLDASAAVICNAPGTLEVLQETHVSLPPAIALHNGTLASRARTPNGGGSGIGYVGSVRPGKDLECLAAAAEFLQRPVTIVGPDPVSGGWMRSEGALPHREIPDRLAKFAVLVLPLRRGLFGERLTSPLKLWDYLASGVPIVAANTPAVRSAAGNAFEPYEPGDARGLADAIRRVLDDRELQGRLVASAPLRTWNDRAAEQDAFLADTIGLT